MFVIAFPADAAEAPSHGKPIILYDIMSNGANNYMNLAAEVLERNAETK